MRSFFFDVFKKILEVVESRNMLEREKCLQRSFKKLELEIENAFRACGFKNPQYQSKISDFPHFFWGIHFEKQHHLVESIVKTAIERSLFEFRELLSLFFVQASEKIEGAFLEITPFREDYSLCVLNAVIADSLQLINDEAIHSKGIIDAVLKKHARTFSLLPKGLYFSSILDKKTVRALDGIFTEAEVKELYEMMLQEYVLIKEEELNEMIETFQDHELVVFRSEIKDLGFEAKAKVFFELICPKMERIK